MKKMTDIFPDHDEVVLKTNERISKKTGKKLIKLNFWCPEDLIADCKELLNLSYNGNFSYFTIDAIKRMLAEYLKIKSLSIKFED